MVNRYCVHVRKSGAGSRPPDRERSEGKLHSRRRRSLFRHAGLAQAGEIRGFEDGLGLRLSCNHGPQSADARIAIVAAQSAGFGEFCGGAFALAFESVGRGEPGVGLRTLHRVCATRLARKPPGLRGLPSVAPFQSPNTKSRRRNYGTGHADLPHPALGQDVTPSPTTGRVPAVSAVRAGSARKGARVDSCRPWD